MIVLQSPQGRFHWHRFGQVLTFTPAGKRKPTHGWDVPAGKTERDVVRMAARQLLAILAAAP